MTTAAAQGRRAAVVGAGPSGFYTTEALLKTGVAVDLFERLPNPFGLVRSGVAPDHPKLKNAIKVYEQIAAQPGFRFFGNVSVGRDVTLEELRADYDAVVLCYGAESDRRLGIPGESLRGVHTATEFVGWYNGHPDYRDRQFDLSHETAVIIGQGNVAADVARILAKTVEELRSTDIAAHALDALAGNRIREIQVIGRRGPAQAKFTSKELKEFGELVDADACVDPRELELDAASSAEAAGKSNPGVARNLEIFARFAQPAPAKKSRRCVFRFLLSPIELRGRDRLESVVLERNRLEGEPFETSARGTGERVEQRCGLLLQSIGYKGTALPGVPFDARRGIVPNDAGRVLDGTGRRVPGLYCAGWIKRGATGIIGTNRADAAETVEHVLAELATQPPRGAATRVEALLTARAVESVDFGRWSAIDRAEIARGVPLGKPREKFTRVSDMLRQSES
jgi:ferredoxin--NADP+ reductase